MNGDTLPKLDEEPTPSRRRPPTSEALADEAAARRGQLLASKYRLDEVLGSGGMAHVYRATNVDIGRTVAVKMLHSAHTSSSDLVERFLREARTANLVRHPNVVDVIDVGKDADGSPFLVQEYLEGETLFDYVERQGGRLPLGQLVEIIGPVLSGVAEAHERSVVHRDLKPENVFLARERGRPIPKILDFGISKVRSPNAVEMTAVGVLMGTPAYMAPELVRAARDADARTDVWALGVMIYEMASARLPFDGDNVAQVLAAICSTDAPSLAEVCPTVPPSVARVVARCLRPNPDDRFRNAGDLAIALSYALEQAGEGAAASWSLRPPAPPPSEPSESEPPRAPVRVPTLSSAAAPASIERGRTDPPQAAALESAPVIRALEPVVRSRRLPFKRSEDRSKQAASALEATLRETPERGERVCLTSSERTVRAPAGFVWAILSDTNRWDRAVGVPPSTYTYEEIAPGVRARIGQAKMGVLLVRWVEVGEWIEGDSVWGERRFIRGWLPRAGYRVLLREKGERTVVTIRAYAVADDLVGWLVAFLWRLRFSFVMRRYFDALEKTLAETPQSEMTSDSRERPASTNVRATFARRPPDALLNGRGVHASREALTLAARRLEDLGADRELVARIVELVDRRPNDDVAAMRPFELADAWRVDRRAVLHAFVRACRAGLLDLVWQINCPRCRVGAAMEEDLGALSRPVHCDDCAIAFDADFAHNVEAIFRPNAAVRRTRSVVHCAGSPWFRPHVYALFHAEPGCLREVTMPLPDDVVVRVPGTKGVRPVSLEDDEDPGARLHVTITPDGIEAKAEPCRGKPAGVTFRNATRRAATLLLERGGWESDFVRGSLLMTIPGFLDLVATDAPATGFSVAVGTTAILFSDLTGSAALYESLGDAKAFALVQKHFREATEIIAKHEGAILKTMGDAVMATFASAPQAVRAAVALAHAPVCETDERFEQPLAVKIGVHEGPALMVHANGRLDVFGTTVNVASRLQARARAGELVMLESTWERVVDDPLLAADHLTPVRFRAVLRGLTGERALVAVDPTGLASKRQGSRGPSGRA